MRVALICKLTDPLLPHTALFRLPMGGLVGVTQKTTTNEKFETGPSSWQKGYLDQAFGEAKNIYGQSAGSPYYQGDTYAGLDDNTKASLDRLKSRSEERRVGKECVSTCRSRW